MKQRVVKWVGVALAVSLLVGLAVSAALAAQPLVQILSPLDNAVVSGPTVPVTVDAVANKANVRRVCLHADRTLIYNSGSISVAAFHQTVQWNATPGRHYLTATAYDPYGNWSVARIWVTVQ